MLKMCLFFATTYVQLHSNMRSLKRFIVCRLRAVAGIYIVGEPKVSVIGIASHDFNIYRLSDALTEKGWNLNPLQFPSR